MLKNKERRDTILLLFMSGVILLFIIYLLIPFGGTDSNKKGNQSGNNLPSDNTGKMKNLDDLNKKLENQLTKIFSMIMESDEPFINMPIGELKAFQLQFKSEILDKFYKFSFYDLDEIVNFKFPKKYSDSIKFNIFLSSFLIKIVDEGIVKKMGGFSKIEFERTVDLKFYNLINNEIEKDYQSLPILFYFKLLLNRVNIYQVKDEGDFFIEKINKITDLSSNKYLIKIKELFSFSIEDERYSIEWTEYDSIGSNDKKTYGNLSLKTFNFLKQKYLIFPDPENPKNNRWIKELIRADSGDIELIGLNIQSENPQKQLNIKKIVYASINSQFIVLLSEFKDMERNEFLDRAVKNTSKRFHKNFNIINFSFDETEKEIFKEELKKFGNILKKSFKNL